MLKRFFHIVDVILSPVPGWIFLLAGLALLAMGVLVPAWEESRKLAWDLDLMREQQRRLATQEKSYKQFDEALAADDPIVVERMAYLQLKLKPIGTDPIEAQLRNEVGSRKGKAGGSTPASLPPSVEQMLHKEMPQPGVNYPVYQPVDSRLTRLAKGNARFAIMIVGVLFVAGGLLMSNRRKPSAKPHATDHTASDAAVPVTDDETAPQSSPAAPVTP